jgi:predicted DNA-binding protein YlxM (UPF0122 family)
MQKILELYYSKKYTVQEIADMCGMCVRKMYYELKKAGCTFDHKWRKPMTEENRMKISKTHKGKVISEEQRRKISEHNSCNYNGLNGYGHTKKHNRGYVLAYVPKHPKAHSDGYAMLHTVLYEQSIGRYLNDNEVVHHINHDRSDNRLENLMLMDKHEHFSMHMRERHKIRKGI